MKKTQKYTQGPWHFDGKTVSAKGQPNVCRLENGHLIAAAPDLLAALKGLMQRAVEDAEKYAQNGNEPIWAYISDASDAIAKAEGVQ